MTDMSAGVQEDAIAGVVDAGHSATLHANRPTNSAGNQGANGARRSGTAAR